MSAIGDRLDPGLRELEQVITELTREGRAIGYWRKRAVHFTLLDSDEFKYTPPTGPQTGEQRKEDVLLEQMLREANNRVRPLQRIAEGYVGWLLTNPEFQTEHDELLLRWQSQIQQYGLEFVGCTISTAPLASLPPTGMNEPGCAEFNSAVRAFLVKWRLQQLTAPGLPHPMTPVMGGQFPLSILQQLMDSGGIFYLPDTFPIPSRDELRSMLVDALRSSETDHLVEWRRIIDAHNSSKTTIGRFARLFRVVLYWRAFWQRHGVNLNRCARRLQVGLAKYLKVNLSTLRGDFQFIEKRLGKNWQRRHSPLICVGDDKG
jgi:hypothetical protein